MAKTYSPILLDSYTSDPVSNIQSKVKVRSKIGIDPQNPETLPVVADENEVDFAQWLPENNGWNAYTETLKIPNVPNGQTIDSFLFENTPQLNVATANLINNLGYDTAKEFARLSFSPGVLGNGAITNDPSAGSGPGSEGIQAEVSASSGLSPLSPKNTNLRYPLSNSTGYDFLMITEYEYLPPGLSDIRNSGNFGPQSTEQRLSRPKNGVTVSLPMQPGLSETNSVSWGEDRLNPIQGALAGMAAQAIGDLSNVNLQNAIENFVSGGVNLAESLGNDPNLIAYVKNYFAGQAVGANITARSTGTVINPNLELLFTGPNLRTFNYNYTLTPREQKESEEIRNIIYFFKKSMSVVREEPYLFLKTPRVFKLKYIYGDSNDQHPFLNKIKTCALTNFTVNYTPDGSYMTYDDGSMTSYNIQLQFSELEPIYRSDYEEDSPTNMGY